MTTSWAEAMHNHDIDNYGPADLAELDRELQAEWAERQLIHASLDALAESHGYDSPHWTADELAIDVVMSAPALDGRDPQDLEPAVESWLRQRRKGC